MRRRAVIVSLIFLCALSATGAHPQERYTLRAENRPIQDFLKEVARITGKNLLVDPSLEGTVTLVSPAPLTKEEVWEVAKSALSLNGYTVVEYGPIVKIVSKEKAASEPIPTVGPPPRRGGEETVTAVIDLKYLKPPGAIDSVSPLLGPEGKISGAPGKSAIIVIDSAANIGRIRELLLRLDVPDESLEVIAIPLERAGAAEIASLLTQLFDKAGGVKGTGCNCRFTSEPRSNSLLIRAPQSESLAAGKLARKLDKGDPTINVVNLKNMNGAQARQLLESLSKSP